MKKILIFYGSYGGGHLSAAKSISKYLEETYGKKIEVQTVDCIEYINKYINKVSTEAYKELAKKAPWVWKHVYKNSQNGALSHISTTTNKLMRYKLNLLIQEFNINVDLIDIDKYCCHPSQLDKLKQASIVHAYGDEKFWNNWNGS